MDIFGITVSFGMVQISVLLGTARTIRKVLDMYSESILSALS